MLNSRTRWAASAGAIAVAIFTTACGGDSSTAATTGGGGGGGKMTLYDKYGGAPTIKKIVGQAITGVTTDPKISSFFAVVGTKGHDSLDDLSGCLEAFFTNALGGPSDYPTKLADGFECRDMKAAHADLGISSDAFDEFIMDLGGVLKKDGVSQDDITTIAGELNGLKSQVVVK